MLPRAFLKAVEELSRERVRGASWSAYKAADALIKLSESVDLTDEMLNEAVSMLVSAVPSMGSVYNVGLIAKEAFLRGPEGLRDALVRFMEYQSWAKKRIGDLAHEFLGGFRVMTISRSSAVYSALAGSGVDAVYVLESLPGGEGVVMCKELGEAGVKCVLIPDMLMALRMRDVDIVLVGADMVTMNPPKLVNKVGTSVLAVLSRHFVRRFVGVFEAYKIHPSASEVDLAKKEYRFSGSGLSGEFEFFDSTPGELVDKMITEWGVGPFTQGDLERAYESFRSVFL